MQVFQDQLHQPVLPFSVISRSVEPEPFGLKMAYLEIIIVRWIELN